MSEHLDPDKKEQNRIGSRNPSKNEITFCKNNLNLKLRQRMIKCYIWSILLYGAEIWTLKATTINRLEAFEIWLHTRMLRIPWVAMQTNKAVLNRASAVRELLLTVKCLKLSYLDHIFRGDRYRRNLKEWTGIRSAEPPFRLAEARA